MRKKMGQPRGMVESGASAGSAVVENWLEAIASSLDLERRILSGENLTSQT